MSPLATRVRAEIDEGGLRLQTHPDVALDVLLDGQRVWSFNPARDMKASDSDWHVGWPRPLHRFLHGVTQVVLREHVSGDVLVDQEVRFGTDAARVSVKDADGHPLAIDKIGVLGRSFGERDPQLIAALMRDTRNVLDFLNDECGVPAFLAFGALLGAVRDGKLIGHDVDVDLGVLSKGDHPVDAIRESFALERMFIKAGWSTYRFSADDFKVEARELTGSAGAARYIDIFGGFHADGKFYLMPNVVAPVDRVDILPLGEVTLEGQQMIAPHDPVTLLEATYGPGWRVPDPTYKYAVPRPMKRRFDGWMRSAIANRNYWNPFYSGGRSAGVAREPSDFAQWVSRRLPAGAPVVDIGAGTGRDTIWLRSEGFDMRGYDYSPSALRVARANAAAAGADDVTFSMLNMYDVRQVLVTAALLAHEDPPPSVYCRFLPHAVMPKGRTNLWMFARTALRRGGRLYLEFRVDASPDGDYRFGRHYRARLDPDAVVDEIVAAGGTVEYREEGAEMANYGTENPLICRLVVAW